MKSSPNFLLLIAFVLCWLSPISSVAQESKSKQGNDHEATFTPEEMGFTPRTLKTEQGEIRYYLSSGGRALDDTVSKPLVLYLDGSGASPLFSGTKERMGSTLMFMPDEFPEYHYAVISKPGIQFHEKSFQVESDEYERTMCLPWRVDAANAVINQLVTEKFIDASHVLVVGHSEGADVAPWVAAENKHVTHVAGLAPCGVSQMLDFVLFIRKRVAAGELTKEEGEQQIVDLKAQYRDIFANPKATDKKWQGHSYLRWSTFFRPAMEAWCKIEKPVYLGYCRDDQSTPVECGEAIELEFIRLNKQNLTAKLWLTNHSFRTVPPDEKGSPIDQRAQVVTEVVEWAKRTR